MHGYCKNDRDLLLELFPLEANPLCLFCRPGKKLSLLSMSRASQYRQYVTLLYIGSNKFTGCLGKPSKAVKGSRFNEEKTDGADGRQIQINISSKERGRHVQTNVTRAGNLSNLIEGALVFLSLCGGKTSLYYVRHAFGYRSSIRLRSCVDGTCVAGHGL